LVKDVILALSFCTVYGAGATLLNLTQECGVATYFLWFMPFLSPTNCRITSKDSLFRIISEKLN